MITVLSKLDPKEPQRRWYAFGLAKSKENGIVSVSSLHSEQDAYDIFNNYYGVPAKDVILVEY